MSEGYDAAAVAREWPVAPTGESLVALLEAARAAGRREGIARLDAVRALVERWRAMSANRYAWGRAADELETALGEP